MYSIPMINIQELLIDSTHLFIVKDTISEIIKIQTETLLSQEPNGMNRKVRILHYRFLPYYLDEELRKVIQIKFDYSTTFSNIHANYSKGICTETELINSQTLFGKSIIKIPEKSHFTIFLEEVLSPFYIFQVAAIILWISDTYYLYAGAIFIMTMASVVVQISDTRKNLQNIQQMAAFECEVYVFRGEFPGFIKISSAQICPGDIIDASKLSKIPCDCILLNGTCVVDEAMLTGESIPVLKAALPMSSDVYSPESDKKYTLYAGTDMIQARSSGESKVGALVIRTGFSTTKGELVRNIIYPKPVKFGFYDDSYKFITVMLCLSGIGMACQIVGGREIATATIIKKCLDLITIVVPPALPACLSIGISFSLSRLRAKNILCISPHRINIAGKINLMCFDKTGTLTEEGLSVIGFRIVKGGGSKNPKFRKLIKDIKQQEENSQ